MNLLAVVISTAFFYFLISDRVTKFSLHSSKSQINNLGMSMYTVFNSFNSRAMTKVSMLSLDNKQQSKKFAAMNWEKTIKSDESSK